MPNGRLGAMPASHRNRDWPTSSGCSCNCWKPTKPLSSTGLRSTDPSNDHAGRLPALEPTTMRLEILLCAFLLSACATGEQAKGLREGMTRTEVEATLGKPDGFVRAGAYVGYQYT